LVVVGGGGGVDIAVNNNGVLTLGEWLFACVARSFVHVFVCLVGFIHSFVRSFVRSLVHVGGVDAGVDIAVDDNGVLTLGEWLFACVARSFVHVFACLFGFIHSFIRSFVPLFVHSLVHVGGGGGGVDIAVTTMEY
jgi:hypothetical protein